MAGSEPRGAPPRLAGKFLVSHIDLRDPNFYRSVVLMINHDEEGAFGLVVNQPSDRSLGEVVESLSGTSAGELPIYVGGPVQRDHIFVLHAELPRPVAEAATSRAVEGVVFEVATEAMVEYLKYEWSLLGDSERPAVRLYAGYSGWGPGQVEGELRADAWVVLDAAAGIVFHPAPEEAWAEAFARKGPLYEIILRTGEKPSMN
jgi:putative transcriptional regulator